MPILSLYSNTPLQRKQLATLLLVYVLLPFFVFICVASFLGTSTLVRVEQIHLEDGNYHLYLDSDSTQFQAKLTPSPSKKGGEAHYLIKYHFMWLERDFLTDKLCGGYYSDTGSVKTKCIEVTIN